MPKEYRRNTITEIQFTAIKKKNPDEPYSKSFSLNNQGVLKKATHGNLTGGIASRIKIPFRELPEYFNSCKSDTAFVWGTYNNKEDEVMVTTQREYSRLPQHLKELYIVRNKEHFCYNQGSGVLMLDIEKEVDWEEFQSAMITFIPGYPDFPKIVKPSVSANIYNRITGELLTSINGRREYILVSNQSDIPRAMRALYIRMVLAGHRRVAFGGDGTMEIKTMFDPSVYHPFSIDFIVPHLSDDLVWKNSEAKYKE